MVRHPVLRACLRRDVLAGLMFIAIAALGLWLSRAYPVGTALRMSTGYMPRLLCWLLMGLGAVVAIQGLTRRDEPGADGDGAAGSMGPVLIVPVSLVAFGIGLEWLGLVVSVMALILIASLAGRGQRPLETLIAAAVLATLSWLIFIVGLGLSMPVWPQSVWPQW